MHAFGAWPISVSHRRGFPRLPAGRPDVRSLRLGVAATASLAVLWLVAAAANPSLSLTLNPSETVAVGIALVSALSLLFGAFLLLLLPDHEGRRRRRWVGAGFFVLGTGKLAFGAVLPMVHGYLDATRAWPAALTVWSLAGICMGLGLVPLAPPKPSMRALLLLPLAGALLLALLVVVSTEAPGIANTIAERSAAVARQPAPSDAAPWYWLVALLPVGLTVGTAVAATVRWPSAAPAGWLPIAIALLAGAQLHNAFWPSVYAPAFTSASALWVAFSLLVVAGGLLEYRRIATGYLAAVDSERASSRDLHALAALRADFTSMVSHEIGSSLAAIQAYADILDRPDMDPAVRRNAVSTIRGQVNHLRALVDDVAMVEKDRFDVCPFEVPLNMILAEGAAYAASLPGDHRFTCTLRVRERVVVDPVRIAQVLRNLLGNAAKYSPPGTPIELRAHRVGERMRIDVVDHGYGIPPEDLDRIFDKFYRSDTHTKRGIAGSGLGLYISRRIVEAHGSRLTVSSAPGAGSIFGFEVEVAR